MAKEDVNKIAGAYRISEGPVTSSPPRRGKEDSASDHALPNHYGMPLLLAIARDPRTLFVCWSVDWTNAFSNGLPADRRAHVRVRSNGTEKIVGVEPTVGSCAIEELEPGETYSVELGYYAPADLWNVIVAGNEVMMPFASESPDNAIDVATVPFHLSFQRLLDILRESSSGHLAQTLARIQERAADSSELSLEEREMLRALDLSADDLRKRAADQASLARSERIRDRSEKLFGFGGASLGRELGSSSWSQ
jgi:hypothetical protein